MGKVYLYNGKKYSNDYWCDIDNNFEFEGDLYDLLEELAENSQETKLEKHTYTFFTLDGEQVADDNDLNAEDLIENMHNWGYLDHVDFEEVKED